MDCFKKNFGWLLIGILVLIPFLIWIAIEPLSARFTNFSSSMTNLGRLFGIIGMVLFAISMSLNTRLKLMERWFYALDRVYRAHHWIGTISFVLLLFHPLFLATKYLANSAKDALKFLLPGSYAAINYGILALVLMEIFLILTFLIKLKYHHWKFTHKFLGVAFILASIHVLLIPSDVSNNLSLEIYMIILIALGVLSFIYRTLFPKYLVKKYQYEVSKVKKLNHSVTEIILIPKAEKLNFLPGQYIFIRFNSKEFSSESHPFTISSSPLENNLHLSIKNLGDYTTHILELKIGTKAEIEGPFGKFTNRLYSKEQIWIAGGIGITPFLSMARSLTGLEPKIELYYCFKEPDEAIFTEELQAISKKYSNFRSIPFCSSKQGRIDLKFIEKESGGLKNKDFFICGPSSMMQALKSQLLKSKVNKEKIHMEEFELL